MGTNEHAYEVIVHSTPEKVWQAITDNTFTEQYYFGSRFETDWKAGSAYTTYDYQGNATGKGQIVEIEPQSRLKTTYQPLWLPEDGSAPSTVSWELQPLSDLTLVKLTQGDIDDETFESAQMHIGWVYVLSSLKSLLETGNALPVPEIFNA